MWKSGSTALGAMRDTHCWLPPWHLPFSVLCYNVSSCADARHRHAPSVLLLWSVRLGFVSLAQSCGRAPGWTESEARGGRRGHFGSPSLRETELQGHGEERQGAHPGRSRSLFIYFSLL